MLYGINDVNGYKMNKYINNGQVNVGNLTQVWREKLAACYSDKPRFYSFLTTTPLSFEVEGDSLKVIFHVTNEAQKQWLEIKMIPEMEGLFKSITGINELSIHPVIDYAHKDTRTYYPSTKIPFLPDEIICEKNLVKDLEVDIN